MRDTTVVGFERPYFVTSSCLNRVEVVGKITNVERSLVKDGSGCDTVLSRKRPAFRSVSRDYGVESGI